MNLRGEYLIFRADASTQIGSGHLMRCLALAQAWKEKGGEVSLITACQNAGLLQRFSDEKCIIHLIPQAYPALSDWDNVKNILNSYPGAWVVLDGYHFDETYQKCIKVTEHKLLVIDDMAHLRHYYADIVLNQNLQAERFQYSCEPYTCLLLGMKYVLLRREFIDWVNNKTEIPAIARRVLVTMGGSDSENYTLKVIQALQKVEIPGLEATVVVGASNINADILEATAKRSRIPIHLIRDARDMPKLMAWADVAVSAGGSTCWELAFMGLPSIILVIADNQKANSEALRDTRMALVLDITSGVTKIRLLLQELLQNRELRKNMSQVAGTAVDRLGAQRIVAHMMTNVDFA